eukprot:scaffold4278_cov173-Amphora_coffeaeformis.AAC.3
MLFPSFVGQVRRWLLEPFLGVMGGDESERSMCRPVCSRSVEATIHTECHTECDERTDFNRESQSRHLLEILALCQRSDDVNDKS